MEEVDINWLKGKIVGGIVALSLRTLTLQFIAFLSTVILTILLSPQVFGVFFVVSAVISFLGYFSDIGLAAALIQKKEEPSILELRAVFTIQQLLVSVLVVIGFLSSSYLGGFYKLGNEGVFLFKAFLISFFLSSLKTIPSVVLERKLEFNLLVIPQIIETVIFYIVAIVFALMGMGVNSFAWAVIARGVAGVVAIYLIAPWPISLTSSILSAKKLLSFGIPFQVNSFLALIKDDLMTIFLGKILPFAQVGYIGWAKKWAEAPLRLIMDSVIRVTFPTFARLQKDKNILGRAIEKSLFFLAFFIFPATGLLILYIKPLIYLVPKYAKWEPGVSSFYFFAFASIFAAFSSPLVNALNALGKIKTTLKLMVFWTILTWILVPLLVLKINYNGVALANFIISFTSVIPIILLRRLASFRVDRIVRPLIASLIMYLVAFLLLNRIPHLLGLIISLAAAIIVYGILAFFWMRGEILPYFPKIIRKRC